MDKKNKQRIIILSDLWGEEKSDWIIHYSSILEKYFEVKYYDSSILGGIDKSDYSEKKLHHQFVTGGIEKAIETILKKEKQTTIILGFSVGGYIGWKACISGLKCQNIFAISSTRLRYETQKPSTKIELIYGEDDGDKPDESWFENLELKMNFIKNEEHEFYRKKEIAEMICKMIITLNN